MKRLLLLVILTCFSWICLSQNSSNSEVDTLDSLVVWVSNNLGAQQQDSVAVLKYAHKAVNLAIQENSKDQLGASYQNLVLFHLENNSKDSIAFYLQKIKSVFNTSGHMVLAETYLKMEDAYKQKANYSEAMTSDFKALALYESADDKNGIAICYTRLCDLLYYQEKYSEGADYCQKAIDIQKDLDSPEELSVSYRYKADNLLIMGAHDDALLNINQAITVLKNVGKPESDIIPAYNTKGNIFKYMKRYDDALAEYKKGYRIAKDHNIEDRIIPALANIGHVYRIQEKYAEALPYTLEAIETMKKTGRARNLWENYMHASDSYEALGQSEKALEYNQLYTQERLQQKNETIDQLESELQIKYETAKKDETIEVQDAKISRQRKIQFLYISVALLLGALLFGMYFTLKNISKKRKALAGLNVKLEHKQKDIQESNKALKQSLEDLKMTQNQLIQAEKMASLGELTAGIAHEIQNPLNFVNNFSEVSNELIEEMEEEIKKGEFDEVKALANDIKLNLEKINHHGQRADAIVKGMLQHSRKSKGAKESTDINALTNEYLRLAYHGLRAKDKSFNATLVEDFDQKINSINVVPQDMGRVILNLITNAFYVVGKKKKQQPKDFEPTVSVGTKKLKDKVMIYVKDNGDGIAKDVLNKIFQPFFTTKPTGQGTGLGLSLSYDIVKAHDGELTVETQEGEGTTFTITLPMTA